ncbi:acyltransferase family protein [Curvibacter sp. HBC61]|uniref:Acyltransferase family protein n=1 Tax=Curvibacter cyanobacteriorum TaxID=3026422 RepID=A0ABT5MU55_9BURK|nr:acyltransferase family protein [Curvibacter sp. HBC61]MDD0837425.1 acyltransferase family protein [Curvibacter sp. HBC61]
MPLIDALKGVACVLIVAHHLAFYGPMSDIALPLAPRLMAWLYDYGRFAVQVFLVVAGYLTAGQLLRRVQVGQPTSLVSLMSLVGHRYLRLAQPLVAALLVAMLAAATLRPWWSHESLPGAPEVWQLLSHVLLLQGWLGHEALSAGVWYVAIDLQLYALAVLLFALAQGLAGSPGGADAAGRFRLSAWMAGLTGLLMLSSLFFFNLDADFDVTGLYFFGAYALGLMTRWASGRRCAWGYLMVLWGVMGLALVLEFRERLVLAWLTSVLLAWGGLRSSVGWLQQAVLAWLGRISYSVFLIHFPVCLVFNAVWSRWFPIQPGLNALGMVLALMLSLACGHAFYVGVEQRVGAVAQGWVWRRLEALGGGLIRFFGRLLRWSRG